MVSELSEDDPCLTLELTAAVTQASEHTLIVLRDEN